MPRTKQDRTADVRTIFQRDDEHKNVDTGAIEKGHWCKLCRWVLLSAISTFTYTEVD